MVSARNSKWSINDFAYKKSYSLHRQLVKTAKSRIDMKPSSMLTGMYLTAQRRQIRYDRDALTKIESENLLLLLKFERIRLHNGVIRSFNTSKSPNLSNPLKEKLLRRDIERNNFRFGCKLLKTKSILDTHHKLESERRKREIAAQSRLPRELIKKYHAFVPSKDRVLLQKLLRPRIFFDIHIKGLHPLGRVIIQLYTEACPEFILELVRVCTHKSLNQLRILRIFPNLWIESELKVKNTVLNQPGFEYKMNVINHGVGPGVLSFAQSNLNGFPHGLLNFSISFKALSVLNGNRVPFGLVTQGIRVIDCIQDYGTKNGKTKKDIIVARCGLLS